MAETAVDAVQHLPTELLEKVFEYLDFRTLLKCGLVSKFWRTVSSNGWLWRKHCQRMWLVREQTNGCCWKETFEAYYRNFGKYETCYKTIRSAWNTVERFIRDNHLNIVLKGGLSEAELDELEQTAFDGATLPLDLRCSLRIHEGEQTRPFVSFPQACLFGTAEIYDILRTELMKPVRDIHSSLRTYPAKASFCAGGYFPLTIATVFSETGRCCGLRCLALRTNRDGFEEGSVFFVNEHPRARKSSHFPERINDARIVARSFTEWFVRYAEELDAGCYPIYDGVLYAYRFEPGAVAQTRIGSRNSIVTVRVGTVYVPEVCDSDAPNFFGYHVQLSMNADADERDECELETRTWHIFDGEVEQKAVENQPGVIGMYPLMRPAAKFNYSSCSPLRNDFGKMNGHFTFRMRRDARLVEVQVPTFRFRVPPLSTQAQRLATSTTTERRSTKRTSGCFGYIACSSSRF